MSSDFEAKIGFDSMAFEYPANTMNAGMSPKIIIDTTMTDAFSPTRFDSLSPRIRLPMMPATLLIPYIVRGREKKPTTTNGPTNGAPAHHSRQNLHAARNPTA